MFSERVYRIMDGYYSIYVSVKLCHLYQKCIKNNETKMDRLISASGKTNIWQMLYMEDNVRYTPFENILNVKTFI